MLIVFTEMILTTFLDFHLMSNLQVEAIWQHKHKCPSFEAFSFKVKSYRDMKRKHSVCYVNIIQLIFKYVLICLVLV